MASLEAVFNHLVLPPKLPGHQDEDIESIQTNILNRLISACNTFIELPDQPFSEAWSSVRASLQICLANNQGRLDKNSLLQAFANLDEKRQILLYVVEQNAALLIRGRCNQDGTDDVVFEVFEASPPSEDVLAAEDALQWDFPGRAVAISLDEFFNDSFQECLATFLEQAGLETISRFAARSAKAKTSVIEARDTTNPALVTQMLMSLLEAIGSSAEVPRLRKRVRDDVSFQTAEFPWRRLPFWLILRVATQRQLCLDLGDELGRACYKLLLCTLLGDLLRDCTSQLAPELIMLLRSKICRRLAKLELERSQLHCMPVFYSQVFDSISSMLKKIISNATEHVEKVWARYKTGMLRQVPRLPLYADKQALLLSLPNSKTYLKDLLTLPRSQWKTQSSIDIPPMRDGTMEQVAKFTSRFFHLTKLEKNVEYGRKDPPVSLWDCEARCEHLGKSIHDIFKAVGNSYDSNPEQMSIFILTLFDLWVQMDECATRACPILKDYAPVFHPGLLDVLQLPTLSSMQRLQKIQSHLKSRLEQSLFTQKTIFSEGCEESFATKYLKQCEPLRQLQQQIEQASIKSRSRKEAEWEKACKVYDNHTKKIVSLTCVCTTNADGSRNVKGCTKCWHRRSRKRMKIAIHEDLLPKDSVKIAAVLLELRLPSFLAAYRNATFKILIDLAHPSKPIASLAPDMVLKDYSQLEQYMGPQAHGITLASAKKSFRQTHYNSVKMKANLSDIILPLALDFAYYDSQSGVWVRSLEKELTLQHLCGIHIPRSLHDSVITSDAHPAPDNNGPSSYEIIASQNGCPPTLSVHEFMSYQRLLSGKTRRWLTMLVELGSSNLTFSEDTMLAFDHLAVQAGPAESATGLLRDVHVVFEDSSFCERLTEQIKNCLHNIDNNWREMHCMEILITLSLRLFNLTSGPDRRAAERLLQAARGSTLRWIASLRDEVRNAVESAAAERAAKYGFWAALLCRRTFTTLVDSYSIITGEDLCTFVKASVALQENLLTDLEKLSLHLKNMLIRDVKMAYALQPLIKDSIESDPESLEAAINWTWSDPGNLSGRKYSPWQFSTDLDKRWVVAVINSVVDKHTVSQVVHYNFVEGHILLDGKPLGRLPLSIRESEDVKELFGNQHLLTYPSSLSGMSHKMATHILGNEVHFGLRGNKVIIQAVYKSSLLEFVPRQIFKNGDKLDLPLALIDDCVHWLNLSTKSIEFRRKSAVWKAKMSNWSLDVRNFRAYRNNVALVDPHSYLCKQIAGIFQYFEEPQRLTIYQPAKGSLRIEMRHLELSFFVNRNKLLECQELNAEIDPNQDAGTLYGYQSKIVLRDVANPERRSIITPLGTLTYKREGIHVAVRSFSADAYGRFGIDDVLGRLSCPPEPRLLYSKALFHAFTSFVLPDPLTGRTGTEEAVHILGSGRCQPWNPIPDIGVSILKQIGNLSPRREYYPKDKKRLQTITWDQHLTTHIQHESYEDLIKSLLAQSYQLQVFTTSNAEPTKIGIDHSGHLRSRGEIRRLAYERDSRCNSRLIKKHDLFYNPRDRNVDFNVYQIVELIRKQPFCAYVTKDLAAILREWKLIGGFHRSRTNSVAASCLVDLIETDVSEQWGSLVDLCRNLSAYKLVFRLSLLSFSTKPDMHAIRLLAAYGRLNELKALQPPIHPCFMDFQLNESPRVEKLCNMIAADYPIFEPDYELKKKEQDRQQRKHLLLCEDEGKRLALFLASQWPTVEPSLEGFESTVIDANLSLERILPEWQRLYQNMRLSEYVMEAQSILTRCKGSASFSAPRAWNRELTTQESPRRAFPTPLIRELLVKSAPLPIDSWSVRGITGTNPTPNKRDMILCTKTQPREVIELNRILDSFAKSTEDLRRRYGKDLQMSLRALETVNNQPQLPNVQINIDVLKKDIASTRVALHEVIQHIQKTFSANDDRYQWLELGGLWPCMTPVTILEQLRSSSDHQFGRYMKESLVSFGVLTTTLQRLLRIKHACLRRQHQKLLQESQNFGHENWSPLEFPDWLLLEIDSDLLIRSEQVEVAHAIISPASNSNSVLQMNMGKGKTSCIVPMAVALLANGKNLARLIVPKPLLLQTAQTVQSRLGGLVGRNIRHVPFSRRTLTTLDMLQLYSTHHLDMLSSCGVILTTPEHVLSYKLSGLQRLADSRHKEANVMIKFQSWLTTTSRDVLDESDFSLAVKTQLIYPSGSQITVDGHPNRWEVAQILLSMVQDHLPNLQRDFPHSIDIVERPGGFPLIFLLRSDVEDAITIRIIDEICEGQMPLLRLNDQNSNLSKLEIKRILSDHDLGPDLLNEVSSLFVDKSSAHKNLLLIRGLLLDRILLLCLKKRWNVQYGLSPQRHPIAVPFDAKGVPSAQAEFGHPDVFILFTCLAFYYSGLSLHQFRQALQHVLNSDDPAAEYDRWSSGSDTLPESLHHWNVINAEDEGQVEELWKHLRLNRNVLDHYMNNFVFPAHAKQFSVKLQASGWDLPLFPKPESGDAASHAITTGFSGTNDNKMMLPLNIKQDDLPSLKQTNAEVLTYLLQARNRQYYLAAHAGKRLTENELLRNMFVVGIRVLIDAGAYILEMDNQTLVKEWLEIDWKAKAAVYFGEDNRAWVQYRGGKVKVPLLATPFAENLDDCLVYIDEAHTRGTDLPIPQTAHGALTLALGQTKDHTMQAAMRLRQLSTTQCVTFYAPPEVQQSILDVWNQTTGEVLNPRHIDSSHVVTWLLEQTCRANEQLQHLYLSQGTDYCRRTDAQWKYENSPHKQEPRENYLAVIQQPERQTLEQLYGVVSDSTYRSTDVAARELQVFMEELNKQRQAVHTRGRRIHSSALEEVEQEREVEFQIEQVRQVQKPKLYVALEFPGLHAALSGFVMTGKLMGDYGYEHVFDALARTGLGRSYNIRRTKSQFYVSTEFMRTILLGKRASNDTFLRPVEWILWNPSSKTALIVISEEVELLIPMIRKQSETRVHLITYAAPVTKNMHHFHRLHYYVLPALPAWYEFPDWLSIELGIFAGRLYLPFEEIAPFKAYWGLTEQNGPGLSQGHKNALGVPVSKFIDFLQEWLTLCRKGQDIMHTPMGYICQGRNLHEKHPFFATRRPDSGVVAVPIVGRGVGDDVQNAEDSDDSDFGGDVGAVGDEGDQDVVGDIDDGVEVTKASEQGDVEYHNVEH